MSHIATTFEVSRLDPLIERMVALRDDLSGDPRQVFIAAYHKMTLRMREALVSGRFLDKDWTGAVTIRFAELYFEAEHAWRHDPEACPTPWKRTFELITSGQVGVLRNLLMGMNAHINRDLPHALAEVIHAFGDATRQGEGPPSITPETLVRRRFDHDLVNEVLTESIDLVQDEVTTRFSSGLKLLDALALRSDEVLAEASLRYVRWQVWHQATALALARNPDESTVISAAIRDRTMAFHAQIEALAFLGPVRRMFFLGLGL